ncbi:MAG TPA: gamma-glutamyl-gamma-aminobutyrate hydrolase family protein [Jatrophihabitans sp.]|nr:gamma-glutamyl-gamma-aminobutyrate hydrolase family protein [Jatrophihabitans sp.]
MPPDDDADLFPRIGLTSYREPARWGVWDEPADLLPASYAGSVSAAGGAPMLLPPAGSATTGAVLDGLHGLIVTGGADVDPDRYGQHRHPLTDPARTDRDGWELALVAAALERGLPVLAICRGMQVLNVALGGDLLQHLPDLLSSDQHCPTVGVHGRHPVSFADGSRLAAILGEQTVVATYHHQAVRQLGERLTATGWTADGIVEAVEYAGADWVIGVQWHPEVHDGQLLFAAFVQAAVDYRTALVRS